MNWNVDPEIFKLFGFLSIRYYSLTFFLGLVLSFIVVKKLFLEKKLSVELLEKLSFAIFIGILLGARLGHCLFYEPAYYFSNPLEILLPIRHIPGEGFVFTGFQGLASHGGAVGVLLAIIYFCKKNKVDFLKIIDPLAVVIPIASGFIRLGNFFNSEIIGKPTESSFGIIFSRVDNIPRHAAQLYEAIGYFLLFTSLYFLYTKYKDVKKEGFFFGVFLALLFIIRFILEFFKENQEVFENHMFLNMGQLLSIPFIIAGIIFIVKKNK